MEAHEVQSLDTAEVASVTCRGSSALSAGGRGGLMVFSRGRRAPPPPPPAPPPPPPHPRGPPCAPPPPPAPFPRRHQPGVPVSTAPSVPSAPWIRIEQAPGHVGETVEVRGWLVHRRSSGKVQFLVVRDGTGILQCVAGRNDIPESDWS